MANHDYLDFDLELAASDAEFFAHVIQSPGGQGRAAFQLQRDDELLLRFLDEMGRRRRRGRQEERITIAKLVGGNLFRAVFQGDVLTCWRASVNIARERDKGLRLRLRLNHAPALADLPWELLYDPSVNRFFHLSNQFPLVRYLEMPDPPAPLRVTTPLRVLAMLSLPSDYDELRVELEYQQLDTALRDLQTRGIIELHRLPKADLGALRAELRAHEYHILHFIGHGEFDEQSKMGALVLENERGMGRRISGETLGVMLRDEKSLRLVVLNACEGARPDLQDAFGGVAQSLIQQGIPSVIAMQFEITDQAARKFSQEFYSALTTNFPIEAALAEARKALYELPTQTEWVTPVLYSRAPDGVIFNVQIAPAASPPPPPPAAAQSAETFDEIFKRAVRAQTAAEQILQDTPVEEEQWRAKFQEASQLLQRADALQPDNPGVALRMGQVLARLHFDDPKRAREQFRRVEQILAEPTNQQEKRLLAHALLERALLTDPPNEKVLWRAGELADELDDKILLGRIEQAADRLARPNANALDDFYGGDTPRRDTKNVGAHNVGDPNWRPPTADDFNPLGRWNIQVNDMVGSRIYVEFASNGTFQLMQQVGLFQVPVSGSWSYNPVARQLALQGVVNTFQPFILALTISGRLPNGYAGIGSDGIGYVLMRA